MMKKHILTIALLASSPALMYAAWWKPWEPQKKMKKQAKELQEKQAVEGQAGDVSSEEYQKARSKEMHQQKQEAVRHKELTGGVQEFRKTGVKQIEGATSQAGQVKGRVW